MAPCSLDERRWADAEQWLVMAFRASRTAAVDKTELKSLRWQILETSHSSCVAPAMASLAGDAIDGLDEVLSAVKVVLTYQELPRWKMPSDE